MRIPIVETQGIVQEIAPFRERGALPTIVVQLNPGVSQPGSTAKVQIAINDHGHFALPVSAVIKNGKRGTAVYRITDDGKVELVAVEPHQLIKDRVTVSGKLDTNDRVVTAGAKQLFAGASVEIIE